MKIRQRIVGLFTLLFLALTANLFAEELILNSINPEEKDGQFMVNLITNRPAEFISYSLTEPPRVILESIIQDIFTDLNDTILMETDLVKAVKIIKDDDHKISSIIIELKQDSSYDLASKANVVSVYLTPQPEKETRLDPLVESESQILDEAVETEMKRIQELNKLIAPAKLSPTPSIPKPYPVPGRPNPIAKPPVYPTPGLPNLPQEQ